MLFIFSSITGISKIMALINIFLIINMCIFIQSDGIKLHLFKCRESVNNWLY